MSRTITSRAVIFQHAHANALKRTLHGYASPTLFTKYLPSLRLLLFYTNLSCIEANLGRFTHHSSLHNSQSLTRLEHSPYQSGQRIMSTNPRGRGGGRGGGDRCGGGGDRGRGGGDRGRGRGDRGGRGGHDNRGRGAGRGHFVPRGGGPHGGSLPIRGGPSGSGGGGLRRGGPPNVQPGIYLYVKSRGQQPSLLWKLIDPNTARA